VTLGYRRERYRLSADQRAQRWCPSDQITRPDAPTTLLELYEQDIPATMAGRVGRRPATRAYERCAALGQLGYERMQCRVGG
jgi:hypothetical protein